MDRRAFTQFILSTPIIKKFFDKEQSKIIDKKDNKYDYKHEFVTSDDIFSLSGSGFFYYPNINRKKQ